MDFRRVDQQGGEDILRLIWLNNASREYRIIQLSPEKWIPDLEYVNDSVILWESSDAYDCQS